MRSAALFLLIAILAGAGATPLTGQQSELAEQQSETDEPLESVELPVSLERIRKELDRLPAAKSEQDVLRLSFYVRVYGRAPDINVLEGYDLHNGPVPYGAPTYADMRSFTTPVQMSTPGRQFGRVLGWAWRRGPYR